MMKKTNAARFLDRLGIAYELIDYEVDEEDLAAETTAQKINLPPEQVFKTLVPRGDRFGICFAVKSFSTTIGRSQGRNGFS
jgi:Cys-tRNA(Pro)/Cys-tRNA(Cys) deacylase